MDPVVYKNINIWKGYRKIRNYSANINGETTSVEDISGNNVLF